MKSSFATRRKARIIARDADDEESNSSPADTPMSGTDSAQGKVYIPPQNAHSLLYRSCSALSSDSSSVHDSPNTSPETVVKRPTTKLKSKSSRLSFGPSANSSIASSPLSSAAEAESEIFTPKKSSLSRQATERNALRKAALKASLSSERLPLRRAGDTDDERPSYSKEHLAQLRDATPDKFARSETDASDAEGESIGAGMKELDIASKFGTSLSSYHSARQLAGIPSASEIAEKKARRARLANEAKFAPPHHPNSSNPSSDEDHPTLPSTDNLARESEDEDEFRTQSDRIALRADAGPQKTSKYGPTRLIPADEDDDLLEDFETFVSDGRIALTRQAERSARRAARAQMAELINEAEASDPESDSSDSEAGRRWQYEAAQVGRGMEGLSTEQKVLGGAVRRDAKTKTPARITPLPSLDSVLERLRTALAGAERAVQEKRAALESIQRERAEIREREGQIQGLLAEAGERYVRLVGEAGVGGGQVGAVKMVTNGDASARGQNGTSTSMTMSAEAALTLAQQREDWDMQPRAGLGSGLGLGAGSGLGSGFGSGSRPGLGAQRGLERLGADTFATGGGTAATSAMGVNRHGDGSVDVDVDMDMDVDMDADNGGGGGGGGGGV